MTATPYQGVWHAGNQRIVGSTRRSALRPNETAYAIRDIAAFDALLLDIYKLHKGGRTAGAVFSLHIDKYAKQPLDKKYMLALRQTPARLLPFLTPRIVNVEPDTPACLIEHAVRQLQSLFRRVIVDTRADADIDRFKRLRQVTLATSWKSISQVADASDVFAVAQRFHRGANAAEHFSLIDAIDTKQALEIGVDAGFDFASGSMFGCFAAPPMSQYALSRADIQLRDAIGRDAD